MSEELTETQVEELVGMLHSLRAELSQRIAKGHGTDVVELTSAVGRVSRIDDLQQQAMAQEQVRRAELRLAQVDEALRTASRGEYGLCKICGDDIGYGRLRARPESPGCVACMASMGR